MIKNFLPIAFLISCIATSAMAQTVDSDGPIITLERNPGYWGAVGVSPCPFYRLMIFADGSILLEPKDVVELKVVAGKAIKSRIAPNKVQELILEFERSNFSSIKSTWENRPPHGKDCPTLRTDNPTAIISIRSGATILRVEHYHGCYGTEDLKTLTKLEEKIDEAVNIKQWFDCHAGKNRVDLSKPAGKN